MVSEESTASGLMPVSAAWSKRSRYDSGRERERMRRRGGNGESELVRRGELSILGVLEVFLLSSFPLLPVPLSLPGPVPPLWPNIVDFL